MPHLSQDLSKQISRFVRAAPAELVAAVAAIIEQTSTDDWPYFQMQVLQAVPQPQLRNQLKFLLQSWQNITPGLMPESVALALRAAGETESSLLHSGGQTTLVWTGPDSHQHTLRRTDQALLQIINSAKRNLLVVSFAVYNIANIRQALVEAAGRGVEIRICIEAPEPSAGKITFNTLKALGTRVAEQATVYVWPAAQRPHNSEGKHGSLHVKCAVADERLLFISSANLTEYALTLNMELGVLIKGGSLPAKVFAHFEEMIKQQILIPV
ncbi:MAG: hypothetical protein D6768_09710 [Chloroflexi bacterium]|nr:MAG: hypothetical protein D6768_09710 [Chloroflexota bacterium]